MMTKQAKNKYWIILVSLVCLILLASSSQGQVSGQGAPPDPDFPTGGGGPADPGFTYQGYLTQNDTPVNANCDFRFSIYDLHFLIRMAITFVLLAAVMLLMTAINPLATPRKMPEVKDFDATNSRLAMILGGLVIVAVLVFYVKFW